MYLFVWIIFQFFVLISEFIKTEGSVLFIRQRREAASQKKSTLHHVPGHLIKGAHLYVCSPTSDCFKIEQFSIADNHTLNCYELFLPIIFNLKNDPNKIFGHLSEYTSEINSEQKYSDYCRKIKRYNINEKYVLMTVVENMIFTERKKADNVISNELFENSHYFTWILLKLHIYLEESDKIDFFKATKDFTFYFTCVKYFTIFAIACIKAYSHYCRQVQKELMRIQAEEEEDEEEEEYQS
ncbi:hypothetical protein BpHYR1_046268, partial [Brachionus plicatilis]